MRKPELPGTDIVDSFDAMGVPVSRLEEIVRRGREDWGSDQLDTLTALRRMIVEVAGSTPTNVTFATILRDDL